MRSFLEKLIGTRRPNNGKGMRRESGLDMHLSSKISMRAPQERQLIRMRFGIGQEEHSLADIGQEFGLCRGGVRRIEVSALKKLRQPLSTEELIW
jgi:DNA-directed RNA polymerase sigma subunit (sigma70/sigma32)